MLKNPDQRENFFQKVFPEEFGPTFDEALHTLMWLLLSRLEKFLPLQTFQQVASMFDEVSSVLVDCLESASRCEELRTVLQYRKDLSRLDHNDGSLDYTCIISALKLPTTKRTETHKTHTEHQTSEVRTDYIENVNLPQCQAEDASRLLKQCYVKLERLETPLLSQSRAVRRNRGLKMKKILLREKRGVCKEALSACKPASRKTKPPSRAPPDVSDCEDLGSSYMAPISHCSDDDSWSFYSDEDSRHNTASGSASMADSWSHYSDDASSLVTAVSSPTGFDSSSGLSDEDLPLMGPKILSASSRKLGVSDIKGSTPKKKGKVYCFICKEHVSTGLKSHMKTHFPTGDYACPRCDSRFKLFSSFKMHMCRTCYEYSKQQVDPEKPDEAKNLYKCDKCQEAFRYQVSLERHKLTHNELYCSVCRKVLRDTATLARHKASHTLFQCTRCEETFTLFMPLLRHCENIHNISRPFKCNHCPKTLPKLRFLILHEWTHTGHLPVPVCSVWL
uniref:C2H2-type domain-containing protein n=1 Tax=Lates calcarifer TaxID=8187 RepID=A0A4W6EVD8_LATCA